MILTSFSPYHAWITLWCILGVKFWIICFEHFQIFRILNSRPNQLIFEKSGICPFLKVFFFVSTPLLYAEFHEIGRFPQKCIILFCRILGYFDRKEPH